MSGMTIMNFREEIGAIDMLYNPGSSFCRFSFKFMLIVSKLIRWGALYVRPARWLHISIIVFAFCMVVFYLRIKRFH